MVWSGLREERSRRSRWHEACVGCDLSHTVGGVCSSLEPAEVRSWCTDLKEDLMRECRADRGSPGGAVEESIVGGRDAGQDEFLGRLGIALAHHLRNPLASIAANTEVLLEMLPSADPRRDSATRVLEDADRMSRLVHEVLSYTSLRDPRMGSVSVGSLASRMVDGYAERARNCGVDLGFECDGGGEAATVCGDGEWIEEALDRVVANAFEAVGSGGVVRVRLVRSSSKGWAIRVEDSGDGVKEEERDLVFAPLVSASARGLGLGLAYTRRVLERIGASIEVGRSSTLGGACFSLEFGEGESR